MKLDRIIITFATFALLAGSVILYATSPRDGTNQWSVGSATLGITLDSSGNLTPNVDNACDLGTSTYEWKNLRIDGTATIDVLTIDETSTFTGVATFTAQPVLNGGIDINEDVDIDFDAEDEEFNISLSSGLASADDALVTVYMDSTTYSSPSVANYLFRLRYEIDNSANADFLVCEDNNGDDQLAIGNDGAIVTNGAITTQGDITVQTGQVIVSSATTSTISLEFAGAFEDLPTTGYNEGTLAYQNSDNTLYVSTEAVSVSGSWKAVW